MKKTVICCTLISAFATANQINHDFQRRFGPDSAIYNKPLYFSNNHESKKRDQRPRKSFREQIRTRMHKEDAHRK